MKKLLASLLQDLCLPHRLRLWLLTTQIWQRLKRRSLPHLVRMRVLRAGGESQVTAIGSSLQMADMHVM